MHLTNFLSIALTMSPQISWPNFLIAILPVLLLIVLMVFLKMAGDKSALITFATTAILALVIFKYPITDVGLTVFYGILKACFPILIVIIMAVFSYNVLLHTGKMELIKNQFSNISNDKTLQVLLLTWGFGGLLEGMAGFGTAVAIPAAILISLGFKPIFSAVVCLISNSVATGFGAVGIPVIVLGDQAGISDVQLLSSQIVLQLSPLMFLIPFIIAFLTDSKLKSLPKNIFLSILIGGVSLATQYFVAVKIGPETPAIAGSIASIITIILYAKIVEPKKEESSNAPSYSFTDIIKSWSVYGLILLFVILTSPLLPLKAILAPLVTTTVELNIFDNVKAITIPRIVKVSWLVDTGVILFLGSMLGGLIQGGKISELFAVLWRVIKNLKKTIITVCCLISLSFIMDFSGMIYEIGIVLAAVTGAFYPLFAPIIGCLGTFLTGSDTSSNILFGKLQTSVASEINVDQSWLAAANTAGATGGKIISPQSISIATSAIGEQGREGEIMSKAIPYALLYITIVGLVVYFAYSLVV